jgi:serine/threonine-protein kinase
VGTVLEGSVRKAGNRLRITVQLIDVPSQGHLWAQSYDREFDDIFAVQSDIAKRVAEALRVKMLPNETRQIEKRPTRSAEAFILYLKGRHFWNERTRESNAKAARYFEEATKLDPNFALAYAGLADCSLISQNYGWQMPSEAFLMAKEYSLKAIALDSGLAEPHASLAAVKGTYEYDWDGAEVELKRAMELKPSYATAYQWYSLQLWFRRRFDESYEQIKRASALDPLSRVIGNNLGWGLATLGRLKEAVDQFEKLIESYPDYAHAHWYLGWTYFLQSRMNEGIGEARKAVGLSGNDSQLRAELACMLGFAGRFGEANQIIDELKELSRTTYVNKVGIAFALFGAGRIDEGFSYLEMGYQDRSDTILYFESYPWFKQWREDPRWASIEKRLGILHS